MNENASSVMLLLNTLVTNGWWGQTPEKARALVRELKDAGVTDVELSADAMHQQFIRRSCIGNVLRAAREAGIAIVLRVCTTRKHKAHRVLSLLPEEDRTGISVAMSKATPLGRAREAIPFEDMWLDPGLPAGACHEVLSLTVVPNGDVFPCCAGSELCPSLCIGNVFRQSLEEMMAQLSDNQLVGTLVHRGPAYLAGMIHEAGLGHKLGDKYANYCHLCNDIFTDPELASVVRARVEGR
jgi:hypothetical protein